MNEDSDRQVLLTPKQVAKRLNLALGTVYNMISDGRIPAYRINKRLVRIGEKDLEEWLKKFKQDLFDPSSEVA